MNRKPENRPEKTGHRARAKSVELCGTEENTAPGRTYRYLHMRASRNPQGVFFGMTVRI
ncbi:MAG: hypothetical protein ACLVJ6_10255 [Merdibacter sp.]